MTGRFVVTLLYLLTGGPISDHWPPNFLIEIDRAQWRRRLSHNFALLVRACRCFALLLYLLYGPALPPRLSFEDPFLQETLRKLSKNVEGQNPGLLNSHQAG